MTDSILSMIWGFPTHSSVFWNPGSSDGVGGLKDFVSIKGRFYFTTLSCFFCLPHKFRHLLFSFVDVDTFVSHLIMTINSFRYSACLSLYSPCLLYE